MWSAEDIAFVASEHAYAGTHPVGKADASALIHLCSTYNLATGIFDIQSDDFKLALIMGYYAQVGVAIDGLRAVYYWDLEPYEASNSLYPEGGEELLNKAISVDTATGITTITWDDLLFESAAGTDYFSEDLWIGENRRSVLAVIYDNTAKNKPVIQISVVPSPNTKRFLSDGDSYLYSDIQVRI